MERRRGLVQEGCLRRNHHHLQERVVRRWRELQDQRFQRKGGRDKEGQRRTREDTLSFQDPGLGNHVTLNALVVAFCVCVR